MNSRRNPFDKAALSDCITEVHSGPSDNSICGRTCCNAFSDWLDHELEILEDRFRNDITHNSLRNSLLRDR